MSDSTSAQPACAASSTDKAERLVSAAEAKTAARRASPPAVRALELAERVQMLERRCCAPFGPYERPRGLERHVESAAAASSVATFLPSSHNRPAVNTKSPCGIAGATAAAPAVVHRDAAASTP